LIVHPESWSVVGQPIGIKNLEETIIQAVARIKCTNLSFSGGLDSSLMLYFMTRVFHKVSAFTIGFPETHPDIEYSRSVVKKLGNVEHKIYIPTADEIAGGARGKPGSDVAVRLFYKFLARQKISRIIACDGIDEFMCGYYDHQQHPNEETYYKYIRHLQDDHLRPLDRNSGNIKVHLPYLDNSVLLLLSQIPISEKVDSKHRKKIMIQLAEGKIPDTVIKRWKYGFCDALRIKKAKFRKEQNGQNNQSSD